MISKQIQLYIEEALSDQLASPIKNNLRDQLIDKKAKNFITKLELTLSDSKLSDADLLHIIQKLLHEEWKKNAGFLFSFTGLHSHYLTNLCLKLAKTLHNHDNSLAVYQYLMPSLVETTDTVLYLTPNVDALPLHSVILSSDKHSLIPASLISYISHHGHVHPKMLVNPYNGRTLTADELTRLENHSSESRAFVDTYNQIEEIKSGNSSVGGTVQRLIVSLRKGGEHGGADGSENEAGIGALNGIIHFMNYWRFVPEERQKELRQLKSKTDNKSFGELIDTLNKTDKKSFDCVESIATSLEKILREHSATFFQETANDWSYLNVLYKEFDRLVTLLRNFVPGRDPVNYISHEDLNNLDGLKQVKSVDELINLMNLLNPGSLGDVGITLISLINQLIVNPQDLMKLLIAIESEYIPFIMTHLNTEQKSFFNHFELLRELMEQSSTAQREILLSSLKLQIPPLFAQNQHQFISLFLCLSESTADILYLQLIDVIRPLLTADFTSFSISLTRTSITHCDQICKSVRELSNQFCNGAQWYTLYNALSKEKRAILLDNFHNQLFKIVQNGTQLGTLLAYLNPIQSEALCEAVRNNNPTAINSDYEFINLLNPLRSEQRKLAFKVFCATLPKIIKNATSFALILDALGPEEQDLLRSDLKSLAELPQGEILSDSELFNQYRQKTSTAPSNFRSKNNNFFAKFLPNDENSSIFEFSIK